MPFPFIIHTDVHPLSRNYLSFMGVAHEDSAAPQRASFLNKLSSLLAKLGNHAPTDAACDQMGKRLMAEVVKCSGYWPRCCPLSI